MTFPFLLQNFILPRNRASYIPAASTPFTSSVDNNYFRLLNRKCFRCGRVSSVRVNSYFAGSGTSLGRQLHFLWKWAQMIPSKQWGLKGRLHEKSETSLHENAGRLRGEHYCATLSHSKAAQVLLCKLMNQSLIRSPR